MALIVDAYNVLHQAHQLPPEFGSISATDLCRLLERSAWAEQRATVVCDGSPKPDEGDYLGPIRLVYSGPGRDADSVIIDLIDRDDGPRDLVVVSNDREIRRAARRRRAKAMSAERFLRHLARKPSPGGTGKPAPAGDAERWLDEFGLDAGTVEQLEREADAQARKRQPPPEPHTPAPQPRRFDPQRRDADRDRQQSQQRPRRPGESEADYWLREFGFSEDAEP